MIRKSWRKLYAALWRSRFERDMETELAEHLAAETDELIARGLSPADARNKAAATMGRIESIKEDCRESRGTTAWEHLKQDVKYGTRLLLKYRTFSTMALITMALGIGSTTAVFSLIDGILIRPLSYPDPERLYSVSDIGTPGSFDALRANSRPADYAADWGMRSFTVKGDDGPERIKGSEVSANLFQVLGVNPMLGTTFSKDDDHPGRPPVVVLSHDFWKDRYVIGQYLTIDEVGYRIIGVMPPGFRYPAAGVNFWVPLKLDLRAAGAYWGSGGLSVIARLRPGITSATASAEMRSWIPRIRAMFPWRMPDAWGAGAEFTPLKDFLIAGVRVKSLMLLGLVALVLLIAIVNVANLLIGQAASRERELTIRVALGATGRRLARQLLTEAMLLAVAGGACGTLLAFVQLALLKRLLPPDTPNLADLAIDGRILAFAAALSIASGLLFGLVPAWRPRRRTKPGNGGILVMTEAAFATILIVCAGLLLHSFWTMINTDFGFQVDSVVTAELSSKKALGFDPIRTRLAAYPGVASVGAMNVLPLTPEFSAFTAAIEDHLRPPQEPQIPLWSTTVTPDLLNALGVRLLQGRAFTAADSDGAPPVVLISRATAQRYWPGKSPLGKHLRPIYQNQWRTIVGVIEEVKAFGINGPPAWAEGSVYLPLAQAITPPSTLSLVARVSGDPYPFEQSLRGMTREACPNCAVSKIAKMGTVVADAEQAPRSMAWLVGSFALLALGMAAAGIYGVVSHSVLRRTKEIGMRLALGSSRTRVAWLVLGNGLRFTLFGSLIGLSASWALVRWIRTLLYQVPEHDFVSFSAAPVVLVLVAICASFLPMRRAAGIDPARSLREG